MSSESHMQLEAITPESLLDIGERAQSIAESYVDNQLGHINNIGAFLFTDELLDLYQSWFRNPAILYEANREFWTGCWRLTENNLQKFWGIETEPVVTSDKGDRRFMHHAWDENPVFNSIKQLYLLSCQSVLATLVDNDDMDDKNARKLEFYFKQWLDAMAPTNFIATNPEVLEETLDTHGGNLMRGLQTFIQDMERSNGRHLMPRMADSDAFEIGRDVAITSGKVIHESELFQLIQYEPTTTKVYERPLLIVPPWINKYYILDLRAENSFIKWAVDQGHSVFIVSWVNPDETHSHKTFEDYMIEGVVKAIDLVREETGVNSINTIGYCIGGTMLAATNAWLTQKRRRPIASSTFFTTMIDFSEPGDLGVFIDDEQLDALDTEMGKNGYLDGSAMAMVFNLLRANDLIWPFFINNYLMGQDPTAFDLLYWNSDSTRLPMANHSFYLRNCYLHNHLREPGGITLGDVAIDISKIKTPAYFISTREDHITPWKSTYAGARLFSGPVRFVLGGSGHIAGVINPPVKNKYCYWSNDGGICQDADAWLEDAKMEQGSWWPDWLNWIKQHAGKKVAARQPGAKLGVLEDAPGSYVKKRIVPE